MKTGNKVWKAPMGIFMIFLVFILVLFIQYLYLALSPNVYGIDMQDFASRRNTYKGTLYAKRGTIYDIDNNILATDVSSYTVIAYLDESRTGSSSTLYHVADKQMTAEALSPIINMSVESILNLLDMDVYQVELGPGGRGISELTKNKIEELNLPGIGFIESQKRYYPNGDFASYVIGYTKRKDVTVEINGTTTTENIIAGENIGIEGKYDNELRGTNGYIKYQQDRYGYKIPDTKEETEPAIDGSNIYLSIDSNIQRILENAIDESEQYNPDWVNISVMDAKTGYILGSVTSPSYDPNKLNITNYENFLTYPFEPGSTMKIFTYMCALEKGTYDGDATYMSGNIEFEDGKKVYDWNGEGWGQITYDYGFQMSSNVGVANIVEKYITKDELKQCFQEYGFGEVTGVELPREFKGQVTNFNYPIEVAAASYGQGIYTTPIQHLQALSIIANDGYMLKPHIVKKITSNGEVIYETEIVKTKVVSKQTTDKLKELMYNTVHGEGATGVAYNVEGLNVIGKTGTAEIYDNEQQKYVDEYIYSFSGMFPKDDPEIIIVASMQRANTSNAVRKVTRNVIASIGNYLGLMDSNVDENSPTRYELSSFINQKTDEALTKLETDGLKVTVLGKGDRVIGQYPVEDTTILSNEEVILITNDNITMPSLIGYSRIKVISILNQLNIDYEIDGYGFVDSQSIEEGSIIEDKVLVTLKEKYIEEEKVEEG